MTGFNKNLFYSYKKLYSYNALFNFVIGERGVGKTYGKIVDCIKDFKRSGGQFVYLRRFNTELKKGASKLLNPINLNEEFPEVSLKYQHGTYFHDDEIMGYAIALSNASILKSTNFEKVKTIVFDEFLLNYGFYHYLTEECTQFFELYETISRLRDVKVFFLGNATSVVNPYFEELGLSLPKNTEFKTFNNGTICVTKIKNQAYRDYKSQTRFGELIKGTKYAKYAIDNDWLLDEASFIGKRPPEAKFKYSVTFNKKRYGIWVDVLTNLIYFSEQYDKNNDLNFCFQKSDHNSTTALVGKTSAYAKILKNYFMQGSLICENLRLKTIFMELLKHI